MGQKLKKLLALNVNDLPVALGFVAAPWVLVHLVTCVVMLVVRPDESIMISGMLLPLAAGVAAFTVTSGNFQITFLQAVKFSSTRKTALKLALCQTGLEALASTAMGFLLLALERLASLPVWRVLSGNPELLVDDFGFVWWSVPLGALVGYVLGLWYAAVILRFGTKGYWAFMIAWLGSMAIFQILPWKTHEVTNVLIPVLVVLGGLAIVWSVWTLLRISIMK